MRPSPMIVYTLLLMMLSAIPGHAAKRVALTIGNSEYGSAPLRNSVNDATAMAALFKAANFDVESHNNLGKDEMTKAIDDFGKKSEGSDIAIIYYAGHGVEVRGANYLLPVDSRLLTAARVAESELDSETVSLRKLLTVLKSAQRLRLVILDVCHVDNTKLVGCASKRGLAPVGVPDANTLVAVAAVAGSSAMPGKGEHSPYTAALLKFIATPGLDIREALGRVRDEVNTTNSRQEPYVNGSMTETTSLVPPNVTPPLPPCLVITTPYDNSTVVPHGVVRGTISTSAPNTDVWVVVHPLIAMRPGVPSYYVQGMDRALNGIWTVAATFGDDKTRRGVSFSVAAFAAPTNILITAQRLQNL
jgi:Caspase domain